MRHATTLPEPRIATARLALRPPATVDRHDIVAEVNDFGVTRMLAKVPYPYRLADADAFLRALARNDPRTLALSITLAGRVIGGIGLAEIGINSEFGYWLGRAHWGKGYATEAGRAFLAWAFGAYDLPLVRSGVFIDNPASLRVQEKLGFEETGRRAVYCVARGQNVEHVDTALRRERFQSEIASSE
jgi:RimJ/RimL family protein N-acetyltransferase